MAADERRGRLRVAALVSLVILVSTLALTYSRGGIAVMVIAVAVLVALGPDRLRVACLSGIVVVGALPGLMVAFLRDDLTTDELCASQRADDGLLLLVGLAIGLVIALLLARMVWRAGDSLRLRPGVASALPKVAAGLGVVLVLAIAGLAATGWLGDQVDSFTEAKAERQTDPARIVATNSSNRWVWWKEAVGATWDEPLFGYGAGSFPLLHLKYRSQRLDVQQPHWSRSSSCRRRASSAPGWRWAASRSWRRPGSRGSALDGRRARLRGSADGRLPGVGAAHLGRLGLGHPGRDGALLLFLGVLAARPPGAARSRSSAAAACPRWRWAARCWRCSRSRPCCPR